MTDNALVERTEGAIAHASPEQFAADFDRYIQMQRLIDERMPKALMTIQGKVFRKKAYWKAVSVAFGIDVKVASTEYFEDPTGNWGYRVTATASTAGRSSDGVGACTYSEKKVYDYEWKGNKKGKRLGVNEQKTEDNATHHNIIGHAETRAENRAISNLVGFGEVSAEEMPTNYGESAKTTPESSGKGAKQAPTPYKDSGDWDGTKELFFGKYSKEEPPKKWFEVPAKYLIWITENMDTGKGPAHGMAVQEIARRAAVETARSSDQPEFPPAVDRTEVVEGEVVDDDAELEGRFQ